MTTPAAVAFMLGDTSPEVLADLRAAMLRWSEQGAERQIELRRILGLGTAAKARRALRDALLVDASALMVGGRWERCKQLAALAVVMNARQHSGWALFGIPQTAGEAERMLFRARCYGEPLPETGEAYLNILTYPVSESAGTMEPSHPDLELKT